MCDNVIVLLQNKNVVYNSLSSNYCTILTCIKLNIKIKILKAYYYCYSNVK